MVSTTTMSNKDKNTPQRALVFQGGGSLGAYEAGVFEVLYYWIKKDIDDDENVFDDCISVKTFSKVEYGCTP